MTNMKKLFAAKEAAIKKSNQKIFKAIPNVLEGVEQFLTESEQLAEGDAVEWDDINLFKYDQTKTPIEYLLMTGIISLSPGRSYQLDTGEVVEVTEHNANDYKKAIRVGIPLDSVDDSPEDIVKFLEHAARQAEQLLDQLQNLGNEELADDDDLLSQLFRSRVDHEDEFDIEDLTDEQKESLRMFSTVNEGSKN